MCRIGASVPVRPHAPLVRCVDQHIRGFPRLFCAAGVERWVLNTGDVESWTGRFLGELGFVPSTSPAAVNVI